MIRRSGRHRTTPMKGNTTMNPVFTLRPRWVVAVAALLLAPALLAGCSSDEPDAAPSSGNNGAASFASCMRDKGYDEPDPDPNEKGVALQVPTGVDPDQYQADLGACAGASSSGAGADSEAKPLDANSKEWRKIVKCARDAGFDDFPDDPAADFQPANPSAFDEAMERCGLGFGSTGAE